MPRSIIAVLAILAVGAGLLAGCCGTKSHKKGDACCAPKSGSTHEHGGKEHGGR